MMPLIILPPDAGPPPEPGHATVLGRIPLCRLASDTAVTIGPGLTRTYDLASIVCPECRAAIDATNAKER